MGIFCLAPVAKYDSKDQNAELQKLHLELEATKKQLEERTKSELHLKREVAKLHERKSRTEDQLRAAHTSEAAHSELNQKYQDALKKIDALATENNSLKEDATKQVSALEQTSNALKQALSDKEELNSKLSAACNELQQVKDSNKLLLESAESHKKLQQQCQELNAQLSAAKQQQADLQAGNEELKGKLRAAQTINDSTVSSTSKLMTDYSGLQAKYSQVRNELKVKDEMLALLQQQLSEIAEDAENEEVKRAADQFLFRNVSMPNRGRDGPLLHAHNSIA